MFRGDNVVTSQGNVVEPPMIVLVEERTSLTLDLSIGLLKEHKANDAMKRGSEVQHCALICYSDYKATCVTVDSIEWFIGTQ